MSYTGPSHFDELLSDDERRRRELMEKARQDRLNDMKERLSDQQVREAFEREKELLEKERKENEAAREIKLFNPQWIHMDEELLEIRPQTVYIGDKIKLMVEHENGENHSIEFAIKDLNISKSIDPEQGVEEVKSKITDGAPFVEWTVVDPRSKKESTREMDVQFMAECNGITTELCAIPVTEEKNLFTITLDFDIPDRGAETGKFILFSGDEYRQEKTIKDDMDTTDDVLTLQYDSIDYSLKYTLLYEDPSGGSYLIFNDQEIRKGES